MKKRLAPFIALLILQGATAFVLFENTEDFEDDTPGSNPTGPDYSFLESSAGDAFVSTSDAFSGTNSLFVQTEGGGAAMNYGTNMDWCAGDSVISFWMRRVDTGSPQVGSYFALTDGEPVGNFDSASDIPIPFVGFHYFADGRTEVSWREDSGGIQDGGQLGTIAPDPGWFNYVITRLDACDGSFSFRLDVYDDTMTLVGTDTETCSPCNFGSATSTLIWIDGFDGGTRSPNSFIDDVVTVSRLIPEGPTGVAATVTNNEVTPDEFNVRFTLSPDDTNQNSAAYTYSLYYDSGSGTTLYDTYPPGTAVDGVIADTVLISATATVTFWATATDPVTGFEGEDSCTVTVDSTIIDDSDSCGVSIPGEEVTGGDLTGPNGGLFGGDRSALAAALQISEASLQILIGVLLLMLLIAGGWFTYGMVGAAGLGLIGLVMNYALGLFPFWTLYVMAFIGIAVGILLLKMRGVASG